jgi:hypothetical protein
LYPEPVPWRRSVHYWLIANLLTLVHFGFICFVVAGGLLLFRRRWVAWLHIPAVLWGALIEFQGWICPLTPLENHFRQLAGQAGYYGGFIDNYLLPAMYPAFLHRDLQLVLGTLVLVINILVYGWVVKRMFANSIH